MKLVCEALAYRVIVPFLFGLFKQLFADATYGTYPVVRNVFECGAGGNAAFGISCFGVVNPLTYGADVLLHNIQFLLGINIYIVVCFSVASVAVTTVKPFFYHFPVHEFPNVLQILGAAVAVVYIVGVFPYIDGKQWLLFAA